MQIETACNKREKVITLLAAEKLPVADIPASLENFIVAKSNQDIVGVAGMEVYDDYALFRSLAVVQEFRGQGIAAQLLKQIEGNAQAKGLKAVYLLTETAPEYFKRKNYQPITREEVPGAVRQSSEFSHVCPQSAVVMVKLLIQV